MKKLKDVSVGFLFDKLRDKALKDENEYIRYLAAQDIDDVEQYKKKGFTLIELMIVLAIIGILAAVSVPAYRDYAIRARVSEALTVTAAYRKEMELYFQERSEFPPKACNSCLDMGLDGDCGNAARSDSTCNFGVNNIGKYVENIHIGGRVELNIDQDFVVTLSREPEMGDAAGKRIILRAFNNEGSIQWGCYSANVDGIDTSKTIGVEFKHLPSACRENSPCPACT